MIALLFSALIAIAFGMTSPLLGRLCLCVVQKKFVSPGLAAPLPTR